MLGQFCEKVQFCPESGLKMPSESRVPGTDDDGKNGPRDLDSIERRNKTLPSETLTTPSPSYAQL